MEKNDFNLGVITAPRTFHQLGVLILDGSGSMSGKAAGNVSKAQAVNDAVRGMLTRFKVSRHKNNFSFAIVTFDGQARIHTPVTAAMNIDDNGNYDPMDQHGGGTDIGEGLNLGQTIAKDFLDNASKEDVPHSVIMLVMSDGMCGNPNHTRNTASDIKKNSNVRICTTLFAQIGESDSESKEAEVLLKEIASEPVMGYKAVYDADTLRKFFIASVSSASGIIKID
jgi:uncharacterized protein YegL